MNYYEKQLFIDQQIRLDALREFEEAIPMSLSERDKVRRWVRSTYFSPTKEFRQDLAKIVDSRCEMILSGMK